MKTRRQRYDNEDLSAGHNSTPPHSKMMSSSSEHEDRRENHNDSPGTNYQHPNPHINDYTAEYLRRSRPFLSHRTP